MHLNWLPEILEEVAYQSVLLQKDCLHPPSSILSLLLTCRLWNNWLSSHSNPHLYARIFTLKFDTKLITSRFLTNRLTPHTLKDELILRCRVLNELRSVDSPKFVRERGPLSTIQVLWTSFLMILENENKNLSHLLDYANAPSWLQTFLFSPDGGSLMAQRLAVNKWPESILESCLSMWLLWSLFAEGRTLASHHFRFYEI